MDLSYQVMLKAFAAPVGDRYQIITQHDPAEMQILDTGLGCQRTDQFLIFSLTTRPRTVAQKQQFYHDLVATVHTQLGIRPKNSMLNLTVKRDENWRFTNGQAQFLTGER